MKKKGNHIILILFRPYVALIPSFKIQFKLLRQKKLSANLVKTIIRVLVTYNEQFSSNNCFDVVPEPNDTTKKKQTLL